MLPSLRRDQGLAVRLAGTGHPNTKRTDRAEAEGRHSCERIARQVPDDRQPSAEPRHLRDRTRDGDGFLGVVDEEVGEPDGIRGPISGASRDDDLPTLVRLGSM